jgi:hypothetical protein
LSVGAFICLSFLPHELSKSPHDVIENRLSNYQVSISDKADFSTHTYQQDFHVAPNPKKIIQLGVLGKQGRYVRIQLLDKNYLSLAEVQVIGVSTCHQAPCSMLV